MLTFRQSFYGKPRWRRLAAAKRSASGYRCDGCGRLGQRLEVHHVEPVNHDSSEAALFPPLERLRSLCTGCHNREHGKGVPPVPGRAEWRRRILASQEVHS